MPNIFDDPEVKAAMAKAGVVHKPGIAQQVLRDLAPFLAEEGIDLNDPGDASLEEINAALDRATARYNQNLPPVGRPHRQPPSRQAATGSPFIRSPSAPPDVRDITSAPSHPASASGGKAKRGKHASDHRGEPKLSNADRSLARDFERWLHRQDEIAAPSVAEESAMFAELLRIAKRDDFRLRTPEGVEGMVDLLLDPDSPEDATVNAAVATLHDYVHFRIETDPDAGWEEIHDLFGDPLPGSDVLDAVIHDSEQIDPDERRAALAETRLVTAVAELLDWIGTGRKVTPSGNPRLADIAHAAGLLGIDAVGVNKLPPFDPDSVPLFDLDAQVLTADALRVRSAKDVPLLPSWWEALITAELIAVNTYRVTPGPTAAEWTADLPPLELADAVVGLTVAQLICEDLNRSVYFADRVAAILVARLLRALAPDEVGLPEDDDDLDRMFDRVAVKKLQRLENVGVLRSDAPDEFVVPDALRGTVARGIIAAVAMISVGLAAD